MLEGEVEEDTYHSALEANSGSSMELI